MLSICSTHFNEVFYDFVTLWFVCLCVLCVLCFVCVVPFAAVSRRVKLPGASLEVFVNLLPEFYVMQFFHDIFHGVNHKCSERFLGKHLP